MGPQKTGEKKKGGKKQRQDSHFVEFGADQIIFMSFSVTEKKTTDIYSIISPPYTVL